MSGRNDDVSASNMAPLMVQLLYDQKPNVDGARLTERVKAYCGGIDACSRLPSVDGKAHYFMTDAPVTFAEGTLLSQLCLMPSGKKPPSEDLAAAKQQTWDWPEAEQVIAGCMHMLLATDLMSGPLEPVLRNRQFRGFVRAIQEVVPCQAMHWINSGVLVNPKRFVYQQEEDELGPQLYGSFNVRFFRIEGRVGDMLMDTLGLSVLGRPDLQCHFKGLDPSEVARVMHAVAAYVFEHGDVIENGETVTGIADEDRWSCQYEEAMVGPKRIVLDLNPGAEFAAGGRG